MIHIAP